MPLHRYPYGRAQPAERAVPQGDIAAMGARDIARNRQTEAGATFILITRMIEPQERLEHLLAHARRDAGTVVVDGYRQPAVIAMPGGGNGRGKARGIGNEIGEAALEGRGAHGHHWLAMIDDRRLITLALGIELQLLE